MHPEVVPLPTGDHLRPIRESDIEIDYPAVMDNRDYLFSIFGAAWGWPAADTSWEDDKAELARHERENLAHLSFNYAILDPAESRLYGCIYIDPPERVGSDADISWWVVPDADIRTPRRRCVEFVPAWIAKAWPFTQPRFIGRDLSWDEWIALPE